MENTTINEKFTGNMEKESAELAKLSDVQDSSIKLIFEMLFRSMGEAQEELKVLRDWKQYCEDHECIEEWQAKVIKGLRRVRVYELFNDRQSYCRYGSRALSLMLKDLKNNGLGPTIATTLKKDYAAVCDYIKKWVPSCGTEKFKARVDADMALRYT